jgi:hypothetical protein
VAGYAQKDVGTVSRFWRSGSPVALTDGSDTGYRLNPNGYFPNFISSFDHDIYVAGYIRAGNNVTAVYWKNSQAVRFMEDSTHSSVAQSIVVSANTIAILGLLDGNPNYWQNGIPHKLESNGQSVGATGIAVSGSDVYVSGSDGSPIYWKNGNPVSLNDTFKYSFPTSVFVAGSDVYVAGYGEAGNYTFYMIYWKNGVPHTLGKGQAFSIAVSGDNVYVAGYASGTNETQAIYYKNGQPVKLGDSDGSVAYSIAVLPLK